MTAMTPATTETTITATELARNLSDILNRVKYHGERFIVERNGIVVATLGPPPEREKPPITLREFIESIRDLPPLDEDYEKDIREALLILTPPQPIEWE